MMFNTYVKPPRGYVEGKKTTCQATLCKHETPQTHYVLSNFCYNKTKNYDRSNYQNNYNK